LKRVINFAFNILVQTIFEGALKAQRWENAIKR